jgi:glycosyltransferase involved in cell wall biosynthesis
LVSIVIGAFNRRRFLRLAIDSVREEISRCQLPAEIIVIDGGSTDGSLPWLLKQKDIITIVQHNRGTWQGRLIKSRSWGYFMNLGFRCAQGKYICMLSDDCLVVPGAIGNGCRLFEEKLAIGERVGAVAFFWRNWPEQKRYWVGFTFGNRMFVNHGLFLRQAVEAVNFANEETYSFYHGDGDLCLRMHDKGFACIASPDSFVEHFSHVSATRTENLKGQHEDWLTYQAHWSHLGPPERDWLEVDFTDATATASRFERKWFRP